MSTTVLTVLVCGLLLAVVLLALLVAGLLRSHAEILRSLHELGAGREDTAPGTPASGLGAPFEVGRGVVGPAGLTGAGAPDVAGTTPAGDSVQVAVTASGQDTLVAFLSSGCLTCHGIWERLRAGGDLGLPPATRLVVVTQGAERESASAVARLAADDLLVVMSTSTWEGYEVPGSPYFALVDGTTGRVAGEGSATGWEQVQRLVGEAVGDRELSRRAHARDHDHARSRLPLLAAGGSSGAHREARADAELLAAGIAPGHPSLEVTAEELSAADAPHRHG
ncbi:hypothetical protein GTQ99_09670 [Kineococcus sp. T13]|uniref:hypothetical protein n=1 Tax=Kineococcus vitellinus TaxID=2696565 RepID=UPI0014134F2E|nr:hypothetical protein [Kineococcus vitellinus]NAZ75682.1 hypothetical protein [Kineococcus vitellinus]